jgi:hypothetical protein
VQDGEKAAPSRFALTTRPGEEEEKPNLRGKDGHVSLAAAQDFFASGGTKAGGAAKGGASGSRCGRPPIPPIIGLHNRTHGPWSAAINTIVL